MSYSKIGWEDYPSKATPINAKNLKHMDEGIEQNAKNIETLQKNIGDTDISEVGDGTVTGAVALLNSNFKNIGDQVTYSLDGTTLTIISK